jgi:hypothetical protein
MIYNVRWILEGDSEECRSADHASAGDAMAFAYTVLDRMMVRDIRVMDMRATDHDYARNRAALPPSMTAGNALAALLVIRLQVLAVLASERSSHRPVIVSELLESLQSTSVRAASDQVEALLGLVVVVLSGLMNRG